MQAIDWKKNFDERGRLRREDVSGDEFGRTSTWTYDERDLRLEEVYSYAGSKGTIEQTSRWKYDAAGQPGAEHIARTWDLPWAQTPSAGHTVKLQRYFRACGSGELLFAEDPSEKARRHQGEGARRSPSDCHQGPLALRRGHRTHRGGPRSRLPGRAARTEKSHHG